MPDAPVCHEPGQKRVRAYLGGHLVVDTDRPLLVWEGPQYPAYYLPREDVVAALKPTGATTELRTGDRAQTFDVVVGGARADGAARIAVEPSTPELAGHVRIPWRAMDAWFEEDEQVTVHPRDPYVRIDALSSTRHVTVEVAGEVVADTRAPVMLYETGLIARRYLPATDVRRELLEPSQTVTHCPYKGTTRYYHVVAGGQRLDDVAWEYPTPLPESRPIAGRICFDDVRVDVTLDGRRLPRPERAARTDVVVR